MGGTNIRGWIVVGMLAASVGLTLVPGAVGADDPSYTALRWWQNYNNLGWMAYDRGDYKKAGQSFRLAIETMKPYEAGHKAILARSYFDYAQTLCQQGRYAAAEPLTVWALKVRETSPGAKSESLAQCLDLLARIHLSQKQPAKAEPLLVRLVALEERVGYDQTTPDLIAAVEALANAYAAQSKFAEAEPAYRRALTLRAMNSADNLKRAKSLEISAGVIRNLAVSNNSIQAERLAVQAKVLRDGSLESLGTATATEGLADVLGKTGRMAEAEKLHEKARMIRDVVETKAARAAKNGP